MLSYRNELEFDLLRRSEILDHGLGFFLRALSISFRWCFLQASYQYLCLLGNEETGTFTVRHSSLREINLNQVGQLSILYLQRILNCVISK